MIGWILLSVLLVFLLYLLFVPIIIFVDTDQRAYFVQLKGLAKASVEGDQREIMRIRLDALFTHFYFYPLRKRSKSKSKTKKVSTDRKKSLAKTKSKWLRYGQIGRRIIQSFQFKKFQVVVDTGDCIQNARLYPAAAFLDAYVGDFQVNYRNRNYLGIHLVNRPINLLKAFINP